MIKENKSLASCCINTQNQLQCYISSTNRNIMLKSFIIHTKIEVSKKKAKKIMGKQFKTLLKDFKEDLNKCRDLPCPWIGKCDTVI